MRWIVLTGLLLFIMFPAGAARRVTVAQLEQVLSAATAAHKSDAEIVRLLKDTELVERLSGEALTRLSAHFAKDSQAATAFDLIVDQSEFLDPPASEQATLAVPDDAEQRRMLEAARSYASQTMPRLPNFLATRTINRYDDSPQTVRKDAWPVRAGLHRVDTSSREVSVRDERENQPPTQGSAVWKEEIGLISGGEFGSTLGMILFDSSLGKLMWSHWENSPMGPEAVFHYSVPKAASHFEIIGTLLRQASVEGSATSTGGARGISGIGVRPNISTSNTSTIQTKPGYHGSLWLDPANGTILRLTMEADTKDIVIFKRAEILVEYGSVKIGDGTFICPVRSLAVSHAVTDAHASSENAPTEWLNETLFTGYRRFGSTTEILPEPEAPKKD